MCVLVCVLVCVVYVYYSGTTLPAAGAAITVVGWGNVPSGDLSNDLLKVEYVNS